MKTGNIRIERKDGKLFKILACPHCGGDVAKQAGTFLEIPERKKQAPRTKERNKKPVGYVYLMQSINGYYKIGIAKDVRRREKDLNRQFPVKIHIIHSIASSRYRMIETKLHQRFSSKRVEYEWFSLSQEDVNWIKQFKDYGLDDYQF